MPLPFVVRGTALCLAACDGQTEQESGGLFAPSPLAGHSAAPARAADNASPRIPGGSHG